MAYFNGVGHDFAHAAFVDIAHGENVDAGFFDDFAFLGVEIAGTDDDDVAGLGFRFEAAEINQFGCAVTHDGGERHAVNVAGRRGFGRIHVAVRIEPDVADLFFFFAEMTRRRRAATPAAMEWSPPRTSGRKPSFRDFSTRLGDVLAGLGDFLHILGALFADRHFFRLLHFNVADVFDGDGRAS